jgi:drug/metabolite transporter (DMT)-like permease
MIWVLGISIALLTALNTISWGFAIREIGDPQLSLDFLLRLVFNKWYVLALVSALVASILSYAVLREMGVLVGRFFLAISAVTTILAATLFLGEKLTLKELIGVTIIMIGVVLIGR